MRDAFVRIGLSTFAQGTGKILSVLIGLFSVGILTRYLGVTAYGSYALVFAYLAFFGAVSDLGLNVTVINELSKKQNLERLTGSYLWLKILTSLASFVIPVALLVIFPYSNFQKTAIFIGAFAFGIGNLAGFGNTFLQARLRLDLMTAIDLVGRVVTLFFTLLLIYFKANLLMLLLAVLMGNLSIVVLNYLFIKSHIKIDYRFDSQLITILLKKSLPIGLASLLSLFYFRIDTVLLSVFKGTKDVGIYSLSYKIFENLLIFWAFYIGAFFPLFSRYHNEKNTPKYSGLLKKSIVIALVFGGVVMFSGILFAPLAIKILGGSGFDESVLPLRILFLASSLFFINTLFYYLIFIKDKVNVLLGSLFVSLVINVILNLALIPKYSYVGASIATVITELLLFVFYIYHIRKIKV